MAAKHILVVDDEGPMREVLSALLGALGHTTQTAATAAEALAHVETTDFGLCFLDFHMPDIKGDCLAQEIRRRKPGVPVILVTGDERQGLSPGIDRILSKPFSLAELQQAIQAL